MTMTPTRPLRFLALLILAVLSPLLRAELPEDVLAVLDRSVEALGGRERIGEIDSTRLTGTFTIPAMGMSGNMVLVQVNPDKVYSMQDLPGLGQMIQVCDGDSGWAQDPMQGFRVLSAPEIATLKQNESLRELLDLDSLYNSGSVSGTATLNGEEVVILKLESKISGEMETHYYSTADGLLKKKETMADMGPMGKMPATMVVKSYRSEGGVSYPAEMEAINAGLSVQLVFETLELNPEIDPSLFKAPQ